jgi:dihydrofolate synthase / folylpolyglutamate synthase
MPMTYPAALDFLYTLQKHGIKLGLDTITGLLARLGNPHERFITLHVGGTNGKGSTAAIAASILQRAGYRVGLYTSPHLIDFRERIQVDGVPISEERMAVLTARLQEKDPIGACTFFEFTTAVAFQHFADSRVDMAVVEVGMGGRFDATNVVVPVVSAITNISLDHQEFLGHTLPAVAFEKAGIIKDHVPVVLGRLHREAAAVIEPIAHEHKAPPYRWGRDFKAEGDPVLGFCYQGLHQSYAQLTCPLAGAHQLENAACALAILEAASSRVPVSEDAVRAGLQRVVWPGRLELLPGGDDEPAVLLDGAHNPAAAEVVLAHLNDHRRSHPDSRVILVVGMMRDKDCRGFLSLLSSVSDELILTQAQLPRAASVEELADAAAMSWRGRMHRVASPMEALRVARSIARQGDMICLTGSLILVGEVKAMLQGCGLSPIRG